MEEKIVKILNEMSEYLSITQMKKLQEVILKVCAEDEADKMEISNTDFLKMFLDAKKIEGCSERTIQYYKVTVEHLLSHIETSVRKITNLLCGSHLFYAIVDFNISYVHKKKNCIYLCGVIPYSLRKKNICIHRCDTKPLSFLLHLDFLM